MAEFDAQKLGEVSRHIPAALESLAGASLFVTGGTGFIGRCLLALLLHANSELNLRLSITALSRFPSRFRARFPDVAAAPALSLLEGDARNFAFPSGSFTHVIHGAAELNIEEETSPLSALDTTIGGTTRVIELGLEKKIKRILFISSGAVYGSRPGGSPDIYDEASLKSLSGRPVSRYGNAKQIAEQNLAKAHAEHGLDTVTARIFAVVGPSMPLDAHFAIGNFIRDALHGREIVVSGNGAAMRSYIYYADLAAWLLKMLALGRAGASYNAGSDKAISIAELASLVARGVPGSPGCVIQGSHPESPRGTRPGNMDPSRRSD